MSKNSLGGWSTSEFVRLPRKNYRLTYRGSMPISLVRMVETLAWELGRPVLPRITYRVGDPERMDRMWHGGASGRTHYRSGHVTLTAGTNLLRVKGTVLHEMAHWYNLDPTPHGAHFYRWLIALFRRFNVPMSHLHWGRQTKAVRDGRKLLEANPIVFRDRPRDGWKTTKPIKAKTATSV